MVEIVLRRATREDLDELADVALQSIGWTRAAVADELDRAHGEVWVLARGGTIAAFAVAWFVADETSLLAIAVKSGLRRLGFGRSLLDQIEARARERGAPVVHLEVRSGNSIARAFYLDRGYEEVGTRSGYYSDGTEDAVLMRRSLT